MSWNRVDNYIYCKINSLTGEIKREEKFMIGEETISYGSKEHPLIDVFNHEKIWYGDFWIPHSLSKKLHFMPDERYDMDEKSIFRFHVGNSPVSFFMFNPKTKQLIITEYTSFAPIYTYNYYALEKGMSLFSDFIRGKISFTDKNKNGIIIFEDYVLSDLKGKQFSHMIFETLNLFKNNGAKDDTIVFFGLSKPNNLKYFMKTKMLW